MTTKDTQRQIDVKLMTAILEAQQHHGVTAITRREMFDLIQPISPRETVGAKKEKLGVEFSDMMEEAAAKVTGANFKFDLHPTGKRKKVRVEF